MSGIRPLTPADLDQIMEIWLAANIQAHSFIPAAYWQDNAPQVRQQLPQAKVYVLEEGGQIAGFIGLLPANPPDGAADKAAYIASAYIAGIFVRPSDQGRGLGRLLLARAKQDYPRLTLHVYRQNSGACRFYQREGFRQTEAGIDQATGQEELTMLWENSRENMEENI